MCALPDFRHVWRSGVSSQTITLTPMANTNLPTPVLAQLQLLPGANYTVGAQSNASVVIYPSPTASGTGLLGQYYHQFQHDLHEQQEFQSHQSLPDAD